MTQISSSSSTYTLLFSGILHSSLCRPQELRSRTCHVFVPLSLSFSAWHLLFPLPEHSSSKWLIPLSPGPIGVSQSQEVRHPWLPYLKWYIMVLPNFRQASCVLVTISNTIYFLSGLLSPPARCRLRKAGDFCLVPALRPGT